MSGKAITTALLLSFAVACADEKVSGPSNPMAPIGSTALYAYASGRVTESGSSQPIAFAIMDWISIEGAWGDAADGISADANGTYQLRVGPQPGSTERRFLIRARKTGYVSQEVEVQLSTPVIGQSRTLTVNFSLQPVS